ncbi:MAG: hypothetical protein DCF13_13290 [Flavobacteriaceae bacterium]|nr:MAG: hypothetical protein DCF13_13290 [Flavobacteriaceae bacterium]
MNALTFLKKFWLDFFSAYHNRLMKNAKYETPLSTLLHLAFVQTVNFNTILVAILPFLFKVKLTFPILFSPFIILSLINYYYFYHKLDNNQRNELIKRKPKYKTLVYDFYDVISTIVFVLTLILVSMFKNTH